MAFGIFANDATVDAIGPVTAGILLTLVILAVAAWGVALHATMARPPFADQARSERGANERVAWLIALGSMALAFGRSPGTHILGGLGLYHALSGAGLLLVATYGADVLGVAPVRSAVAVARRALLFLVAIALGAWLLKASPDPPIDLFPLHQQTAQALLDGKSIYTPGVVDIWDTYHHTYSIRAYCYFPLSAYLTTIAFFLTRDIRWANLAAQLAAAVLLWLIAARCARDGAKAANGKGNDDTPSPALWADLLTVSFLFHPRALLVLEKAWIEPLALPFLGGFVLAAVAKRPIVASVCLGLLCASKQHLALYVPFLMLTPGVGVTGVLIAGGVALATMAPYLLRAPLDLYRGTFVSIANTPFRKDALAIPAALSYIGVMMPSWVGFLAALLPFAWLRRVPREIGPLLLGSCLVFGLFYVLGRQAFCNYYYLLDATALFAAATLGAPRAVSRGSE